MFVPSLCNVFLLHSRFMEENRTAFYYQNSLEDLSGIDSTFKDFDEEKWIFFTFLILMSWCFLVIAVAIAIYAWKENRLMLKYEEKGVPVLGKLSSAILLREGSWRCSCSGRDIQGDDTEDGTGSSNETNAFYSGAAMYLVAVAYDIELVPGYSAHILKWFRLHGDDLPKPTAPRKPELFSLPEMSEPNPDKNEHFLRLHQYDDTNISLLSIPGFPMSAHPKSTIRKSRSLRPQFISSSYVGFLAIFGASTFILAINVAYLDDSKNGLSEYFERAFSAFQNTSWMTSVTFLFVVSFLIFTEARLLDGPIDKILEKEYLEKGEYANRTFENSSEDTLDVTF